MAVPSAVAYGTDTVCVEAAESVTVNCIAAVPVLPSLMRLEVMLSVGSGAGVGGGVGVGVIGVGGVATVSSSTIVPVAADFVSVAFVGLLRATENVSFDSAVVSRVTSTVTIFCISPGANVSVPVAAA